MPISEADVQASLHALVDPNTSRDFVSAKAVRKVSVDGSNVTVDLQLAYPAKSQHEALRKLVQGKLAALPGIGKVTVNFAHRIASQPMMLGISGRPESKDGKTLEPLEAWGVQAMSIGFLIDTDTPMVWRGPMVTQALEQLLKDTNWRDLDYLIVDMPPGTGDIQLTLAQKVPVTGAVIVTTPQDIALIDARKGLKMFEKVSVPIVGLVENMAIHICSKCGHAEHIFGEGGGERMCRDYKVPFLGSLPLDIRIRENADSGRPTVVADPDGAIAKIYKEIARKTAVFVAQKAEDFSAKFPSIVIQNT